MGWLRGMGDRSFAVARFTSDSARTPDWLRPSGAFLYGVPPVIGRIEQLCRKPLGHCLLIALARRRDNPANAERLPARGAHLDRHLIGSAADAARAHLDRGH